MRQVVLGCAMIFAFACAAFAADALPAPQKSGGPALLDCLAERASSRAFVDTALTAQQMSDLLWATGGVNRESGGLTYPTAMNVQDITIYALTKDGVYLYDPAANSLTEVQKGDFRADTGMQPFVAQAAVNLAFVQDKSAWKKMAHTPADDAILRMSSIHVGAAVQNAALYAASQGWGCVVRGSFDPKKMAEILKLNVGQAVLIVESIGPKE